MGEARLLAPAHMAPPHGAPDAADDSSPSADEEFAAFFRAHWDRTVAVARRIVGSPQVAEDLASESFIRAYDRWRRVSSHPSPPAWVLRVAINLALDHVRRGPAPTVEPTASTFDDAVVTRMALQAALLMLSDKQRAAVALRYLGGCTETEIAAELRIRPGTVRTHLARGMARLHDELGDERTITMEAGHGA